PVIVHAGTLILAKFSSGAAHATNTINGVDAGATVQLAGSGDDQIYNGFPGFNFGVFDMNGTFDFNGHSEAFDKLTGTGAVVNAVPATNVTMTLGTNNGDGNRVGIFSGMIQGNISVAKTGNGTQTFSGNNTYTGSTTVAAGSLIFTQSQTSTSSVGVSSGTLQMAESGTHDHVLKTGNVTVSGSGRIDLSDNKLIITSAVGSAQGVAYDVMP